MEVTTTIEIIILIFKALQNETMDETTIVITPTIEIIIISKVVIISIVVAKVHNSFIEQKYIFHLVVQYITAISVRSVYIFANANKPAYKEKTTLVFK